MVRAPAASVAARPTEPRAPALETAAAICGVEVPAIGAWMIGMVTPRRSRRVMRGRWGGGRGRRNGSEVLLPLWEKVACGAGRMRGLSEPSARTALLSQRMAERDPSSVAY